MTLGESQAAALNRLYLRIRDRKAWSVADGEADANDFEHLRGHKYALLITYKRSGEAVPTPVWFGLGADGRAYFHSEATVGKIKRIRANGRARLAPSNVRGKPLGPAADGRARVLPAEEEERAEAAIRSNYGLGRKVYEGVAFNVEGVYVEVTPEGST